MARPTKERVVTMSEVHRAPGKVFKDVARHKAPVVVESNGLFIARIVPYDEPAGTEEGLQLLDALVAELGPRAAELGLNEENIVERMRAIRKKLHQKKYGQAAG